MGAHSPDDRNLDPSAWSAPGTHAFDGAGTWTARAATAEDLSQILAIEDIAQPAPWTRSIFEQELALEWSHIWVVQSVSTAAPAPIVAYLVFWTVHDEVHILNVVVHPDARRRGIARRLIEALLADARRRHMAVVTLEVRVSNIAAQTLYERLDFRFIGRRNNYYSNNGEDAFVMARIIEEPA